MKLPADFDNWEDATYIEPFVGGGASWVIGSWIECFYNVTYKTGGIPQSERLIKLNQIAIQQMRILEDTGDRNLLK